MTNSIHEIIEYLKNYKKPVKIMEVCGTHTSSIVKEGIRSLISPSIRLVSGPGCPVCVTGAGYIDRLIELAKEPDTIVLSYGDLFQVRGAVDSLSSARAKGARTQMIYAPAQAAEIALANPKMKYVVAAVGFETTIPAYALLLKELLLKNITNVRFLTSLKTTPAVLRYVCEREEIDGFLAPGHVSAVTGVRVYEPLLADFQKPFVIAGFRTEHILLAIYEIIRQIESKSPAVKNFYPSVVQSEGNKEAKALINKYFEPVDAFWRGIESIKDSGLVLREEYQAYDAGSLGLPYDEMPRGCSCGDVILGRISPKKCPLFGTKCTPSEPFGPCMVSGEGACRISAESEI